MPQKPPRSRGRHHQLATAGRLTDYDLADIDAVKPNLILLAGGTDYGERETALYNAKRLAGSGVRAPVIYAGNIQNQRAVREIFDAAGIPCSVVENVYPRLDKLNIEPARKIIHAVFEEHIVKAPGMEHIRDMVTGSIIPTPGAVMEAAQLLYDDIGDLVAIDIGGATTDVHSVTGGSEEIAILLTNPEPFAKRTVEGDLGLYINARNVVDMIGLDALKTSSGSMSRPSWPIISPSRRRRNSFCWPRASAARRASAPWSATRARFATSTRRRAERPSPRARI